MKTVKNNSEVEDEASNPSPEWAGLNPPACTWLITPPENPLGLASTCDAQILNPETHECKPDS